MTMSSPMWDTTMAVTKTHRIESSGRNKKAAPPAANSAAPTMSRCVRTLGKSKARLTLSGAPGR